MIRNPWRNVPARAPYVLPSDRSVIAEFNRGTTADFRIRTTLLPEPFLGALDSPVVLLNLNPGAAPGDNSVHRRRTFVRAVRRTLRGVSHSYPFYYLNPVEDGPGHRWWRQRLAPLIAATSLRVVAASVLCVEYFPYHSRRFRHDAIRVPSQSFGFDLVRAATRREAAIVILRGHRLWLQAVPELQRYPKLVRLNSAQNVTVSPRNCPGGFEVLLNHLGGAR